MLAESPNYCKVIMSGHGLGYYLCIKVTKKFSEQKQVYVGMEPSKTNQTRWE